MIHFIELISITAKLFNFQLKTSGDKYKSFVIHDITSTIWNIRKLIILKKQSNIKHQTLIFNEIALTDWFNIHFFNFLTSSLSILIHFLSHSVFTKKRKFLPKQLWSNS